MDRLKIFQAHLSDIEKMEKLKDELREVAARIKNRETAEPDLLKLRKQVTGGSGEKAVEPTFLGEEPSSKPKKRKQREDDEEAEEDEQARLNKKQLALWKDRRNRLKVSALNQATLGEKVVREGWEAYKNLGENPPEDVLRNLQAKLRREDWEALVKGGTRPPPADVTMKDLGGGATRGLSGGSGSSTLPPSSPATRK